MKLGIVGLPNVGKSTLFNAITDAGAQSANYPFCTIEPNIGVVAVPDKRLDKLAEMYDPDKYTPASIEFVDIAGLVKGASKGEDSATSSFQTSVNVTLSFMLSVALKTMTLSMLKATSTLPVTLKQLILSLFSPMLKCSNAELTRQRKCSRAIKNIRKTSTFLKEFLTHSTRASLQEVLNVTMTKRQFFQRLRFSQTSLLSMPQI